jgi:hypothetical protein
MKKFLTRRSFPGGPYKRNTYLSDFLNIGLSINNEIFDQLIFEIFPNGS